MKPIAFAQANKDLQPSGQQYSGDVTQVVSLPVFTNEEQCISCWQLSIWERLQLLFSGKLWLQVLSGSTQPPVAFRTDSPFE